MKKIIRNIKKYFSHFQTKLFFAFLLCTLFPLSVIGGVSYSVSYNIARESIINAAMSSDEQLMMQLNERLKQVENVSDSIQYDMYTLMKADTVMDSLSSFTNARNDISLFKTTFNLFHINVFLPEDHLGSREGLYFFPVSDLSEYNIPSEMLDASGTSSIWFFQENVDLPDVISDGVSRDCIGCCRIMKDAETQAIEYAYILFLDISEFSGYLEESFADKNIASYVITEQGTLIAHNSPDRISDLDENILSSLKQSEEYLYHTDQISYHATKLENGWYHITEIPNSYIRSNVYVLLKTIILALLLSLPPTLFVIIVFSKRLTKKIRILSSAMKHLRPDSTDSKILEMFLPARDPETYDEIDKLGITFQKMQESLKKNIASILDLSLSEERLKYQLLQSQINPHFLYNILDSIRTCQSIGELDTADQMLTKLSRFYRMTLKKSDDLISIKDELEIAKLYLEIEALCHNETLSWDIRMEDGVENYLICKFTLQPFLENSILHGFSQKTPKIHILITGVYGNDTVKLTISDNGIGIREKQLNEIRQTLKSKKIDYEKHFGIGNVNKRISDPAFGNGHISIESRFYHGTKITIEFQQMEAAFYENRTDR